MTGLCGEYVTFDQNDLKSMSEKKFLFRTVKEEELMFQTTSGINCLFEKIRRG